MVAVAVVTVRPADRGVLAVAINPTVISSKDKKRQSNLPFLCLNTGRNGHTLSMKKLRRLYEYLRKRYVVLTAKKYNTLAGTLVFFLIMSIVPLTFWLTLLLGKLPVDIDRILELPIFDSVQNILIYIRNEAQNATSGVSVLLLVTTLYSSTNLFYQMRRSGEIIYDVVPKRKGIRTRIGALLLMFIVMFIVIAFFLLLAFGAFLFSRFLSPFWESVADHILLGLLAFALVLVLNAYICPYKAEVRLFLPGTAITVAAWIVAVIGFGIYLRISNMDKLYGALSTVIVFLLWLYVLMICFIVGIIFNSERIIHRKRTHTL